MSAAAGTLRAGIDVGSTTVKLAVLDADDRLIFHTYERHRADIRGTLVAVMEAAGEALQAEDHGVSFRAAVTGSGGLSVSTWLDLPFVQEVIAGSRAVQRFIPDTDVAIELGGEDAKITYFTGGLEQRMNGTCAGGTGAFIDQMATLLSTDAAGLNELARGRKTIYPIAARCGVFAKTDVQPLINEGARREDIAASILQAVVNQTISGLACGKPIRGKVAFLGGPLHFLPETRRLFESTLGLAADAVRVPEHAEIFVAIGAALAAGKSPACSFRELRDRTRGLCHTPTPEVERLRPLFTRWRGGCLPITSRACARAPRGPGRRSAARASWGSTRDPPRPRPRSWIPREPSRGPRTRAMAADPSSWPCEMVRDLRRSLPAGAWIERSCATGYGEAFVRAALRMDMGEVETIAHYTAAASFLPGVDAILDIGGQDMKFLRVRDGVISSVLLNEACSSGCGSFLETFAHSLGLSMEEFTREARGARSPVDLGSRCTVFMNSRVKQAQKEGATVGDISAGLSYSVIRNALQKVIRLRDPAQLGARVVVQGGTFANDAVLRAFELVSEREAVRPDVPGLMGALGAALRAREDARETAREAAMRPRRRPRVQHPPRPGGARRPDHGDGVAPMPALRQSLPPHGDELLGRAGVRLGQPVRAGRGRGGCGSSTGSSEPVLVEAQTRVRLRARCRRRAPRAASSGIPRVLNMYEDYPFWFTVFTRLGFSVRLSPRSSRSVYEAGLETIPSESVCYPGKLVHGHVARLMKDGVPFIFYPVRAAHPAGGRRGAQSLQLPHRHLLPRGGPQQRGRRARGRGALRQSVSPAARPAPAEEAPPGRARVGGRDLPRGSGGGGRRGRGAEARSRPRCARRARARSGRSRGGALHGVVFAGRPYHLDPEINHGIAELAVSLGMAVLTEDSVAHLGRIRRPLRVVDQWVYHTRLYAAAHAVAERDDLELVQLNSFGCGLDAVTTDQVQEILEAAGEDLHRDQDRRAVEPRRRAHQAAFPQGRRAGAAEKRRPRRDAAAASRLRRPGAAARRSPSEMRRDYTILAPQMSPIHFRIIESAFRLSGYRMEILPEVDTKAVNEGLTFVNNDACFPSILVVGQMMAALRSGRYDLERTALLMTQTGGGCRATNYIAFIRKALADAGMANVPVISLNALGLEKNPGFRLSLEAGRALPHVARLRGPPHADALPGAAIRGGSRFGAAALRRVDGALQGHS